MCYPILNDLKPQEFFKWFGEICKIPHGSKNEKELVEFIKNFAEQHSLEYTVDAKGNVFMKVPATKGYEQQPSILFQAHLDMVCVKEENCEFDFLKDSIRLKITGDKLHAEGTTLGADNGVGVATMLAIADSSKIAHPELEFLFTVEEEIGLLGIRAFDMSKIRSRRMINMDCGDSHVLAVSSMGKYTGIIKRKFDMQPIKAGYTALKLKLYGGIGGHSGLMIRKGRTCAGNNMGELLSSISDMPVYLCELETEKTAILKSCRATIAVPSDLISEVTDILEKCFAGIKAIYEKTDPDIKLDITPAELPKTAICCEESAQVANLLRVIKTMPYREDGDDNAILITLSVLSNAALTDGVFTASFGIRSSNDADMFMLYDYYAKMAKILGFETEYQDSSSGWREAVKSPFRDKFIAEHIKLFGEEPQLERVQGGIETSVITGAIPDMDAVGLAPTSRGAHTTKEHIFISEVAAYWQWLTAVLAEKE